MSPHAAYAQDGTLSTPTPPPNDDPDRLVGPDDEFSPIVLPGDIAQREVASPNIIIGPDDRVQVPDTTMFPYSAVVHIAYKSPDGARRHCTGVLYDDNTVLTAGHCVYAHEAGVGWVSEITVAPGHNASSASPLPYGMCNGIGVKAADRWITFADGFFDYGIIKLDCHVGDQTGLFTLEVLADAELDSVVPLHLGYPFDKTSGDACCNT